MATTYNGHDITATSIMGGFDLSLTGGSITIGGQTFNLSATAYKFSFYITDKVTKDIESCTLGRAKISGSTNVLTQVDLYTTDRAVKAGVTVFYQDALLKTLYKGNDYFYYDINSDAAVKINNSGVASGVTDCGPYSLGYSTIGATSNVYFFDSGVACLYTPFRTGTVTAGAAYLIDTNYPGIPGINLASIGVYSDNAGQPDQLLGYSESESPTSTAGWVNFTTFTEVGGLSLAANTPVWIAIWSNAPGVVRGYRDTGNTNQLSENTASTQTYPNWQPWRHVAYQSNKVSMYLTITP